MELLPLSYVWSNETDTFIGVPMSWLRTAGRASSATTEVKAKKRIVTMNECQLRRLDVGLRGRFCCLGAEVRSALRDHGDCV